MQTRQLRFCIAKVLHSKSYELQAYPAWICPAFFYPLSARQARQQLWFRSGLLLLVCPAAATRVCTVFPVKNPNIGKLCCRVSDGRASAIQDHRTSLCRGHDIELTLRHRPSLSSSPSSSNGWYTI